MGKHSSPPPAPDPNQVAAAQTKQNRDSALFNTALNRFDTVTPFGSQTFDIVGRDPTTGAPIYQQNISLSPQQQQLFNQQQGQNVALGGAGDQLVSQIGNQQPFSLGNLPGRGTLNSEGLPEIPTDFNAARQSAQDALYARNTQYLDPQFQRGEEALRSRLANQGIVEGSEAFTNAMNDFNQGKEQAYAGARNDAIVGGGAEAERNFNMASGARGQLFGERLAGGEFANNARSQALAEELTGRELPFQELANIRGLSPIEMPQFQGAYMGSTAPADITSAINNQYQAKLDAYNAKQQSRNALVSGLFGLGGAFLGGPMGSKVLGNVAPRIFG